MSDLPEQARKMLREIVRINKETKLGTNWRDLTAAMGFEAPSVSRWLDLLETGGYIDRNGGRPNGIVPTPKGRKAAKG